MNVVLAWQGFHLTPGMTTTMHGLMPVILSFALVVRHKIDSTVNNACFSKKKKKVLDAT